MVGADAELDVTDHLATTAVSDNLLTSGRDGCPGSTESIHYANHYSFNQLRVNDHFCGRR